MANGGSQAGPAVDASWRRLLLRTSLLVLLIAPFAYLGDLLSVASHEILGHGLASLCLGGQFLGFHMDWTGFGWAIVPLPSGSPPWKEIVVLSAGMIVTCLIGLVLLALSIRMRRNAVAIPFLALAFAFLLEGTSYLFWNAIRPVPPGDTGRIVAMVGLPWVAPLLAVVGGLLMFGFIWLLTALVLKRSEQWLAAGGLLTGSRRTFVLLVVGAVPAPFWCIFDWDSVVPGIGMWPACVGALAHLAAAGSLYWIRLRPSPISPTRRGIGAGIAAGWCCAGLAAAATLIWVDRDIPLPFSLPEGTVAFLSGLAVSPDGGHAAFTVTRGHGGRDPELATRLHVVNVNTGKVTEANAEAMIGVMGMGWSPEGARIAFISGRPENMLGVCILTLDGAGTADFIRGGVGSSIRRGPRFSPDGNWLGFVQDSKLVIVDVASGATRHSAISLSGWDWCWASDSSAVFIVRNESLIRRRLAEDKEETLHSVPFSETDGLSGIQASPDGQSLGFYAAGRFHALDLQTGSVKALFDSNHPRHVFDWGQTGICFFDDLSEVADGNVCLKVYDPGTLRVSQVATGPFTGLAWVDGNRVVVRHGHDSLWIYDVRTQRGHSLFSVTPEGSRNPQPASPGPEQTPPQ